MTFSSSKQINYSMGFICSEDGERVLLLQKNKGELDGLWLGVGGKVDPGENFLNAMVRECNEETTMLIELENWIDLGAWSNETANIGMFVAFDDHSKCSPESDTNETIKSYRWDEIKDLKVGLSCQKVLKVVEELAKERALSLSNVINTVVAPSVSRPKPAF